jgi:hypothetical protein
VKAEDEMGPLRELLAVNERHTLEFFVTGLKDVCEPNVDVDELLYNASVLAHYALVSTEATTDWPAPMSLTTVFDQFVHEPDTFATGSVMEEAGAQCLLMSGFFENQMRGRHNLRWYSTLGTSFFLRAAARSHSLRRAHFLSTLAMNFEPWRQRHARLSRELRTTPFLLTLPNPDTLM